MSHFLFMGILPRIECLLYLYGLFMIYPSSVVEFIQFRKMKILANVQRAIAMSRGPCASHCALREAPQVPTAG